MAASAGGTVSTSVTGAAGGKGGVNEVMEATNQEVITLESNLPRVRRCRLGWVWQAAAAAAGGALAAAAGEASRS